MNRDLLKEISGMLDQSGIHNSILHAILELPRKFLQIHEAEAVLRHQAVSPPGKPEELFDRQVHYQLSWNMVQFSKGLKNWMNQKDRQAEGKGAKRIPDRQKGRRLLHDRGPESEYYDII
jgi:hypothetical protein